MHNNEAAVAPGLFTRLCYLSAGKIADILLAVSGYCKLNCASHTDNLETQTVYNNLQ